MGDVRSTAGNGRARVVFGVLLPAVAALSCGREPDAQQDRPAQRSSQSEPEPPSVSPRDLSEYVELSAAVWTKRSRDAERILSESDGLLKQVASELNSAEEHLPQDVVFTLLGPVTDEIARNGNTHDQTIVGHTCFNAFARTRLETVQAWLPEGVDADVCHDDHADVVSDLRLAPDESPSDEWTSRREIELLPLPAE